MSAMMSSISDLQSKFMNGMNRYLEEDAEDVSFDETPYNGLSSKSRDIYNRFVNELVKANINHVDTFPLGSRCIMIYPSENVELSCIFIPYNDKDTIEIKICESNRDINHIMENLPEDIYVCDDEIVRSNNIPCVINWMKQLY
jgi:hypothetical protein